MARSRAANIALLGATATALITVQIAFPEPKDRWLWNEIFNAGHAPLYGVAALVVLQILRLRQGESDKSPAPLYFKALALTVAAGLLAEGIQSLGAGDAESVDIARDGLGATAFLLVASAFDAKLNQAGMRLPGSARLVLAGLCLAIAFAPLAGHAVDLLRRNAAFPTICSFDASWETRFAVAREADLERTQPPEGWGRDSSGRVGRLALHTGNWPGLSIQRLHEDWTGYTDLKFEIYSELSEPVQLIITIHDIGHEGEYYDRFNKNLTIVPGSNHISIPLGEIQSGPRGRKMDLSRMSGLVLFADHPHKPFVLYLDAFRLE